MGYVYEKESNLMQDGDYEAIIERMEVKTLPSGKDKLSIMYRIRNDVEQKYGNKCFFEDIWQEKEEPRYFNRKRINKILATQEIEEETTFETINDLIDFLKGASLVIHIVTTFDDYRGEDINTISYYKKTKVAPQKLGAENINDLKSVEVKDGDIPF